MSATEPFLIELTEGQTGEYTSRLVDGAGAGVGSSVLDSATLTYYSVKTGTIINGRNAQNVLNANHVTIDNSGNLKWKLQKNDVIVTETTLGDGPLVDYRAVFVFAWTDTGGDAREYVREVTVQLARVAHNPWA